MGFIGDVGRETLHLSQDVVMETEEEGGHNSSPPPMPQPRIIVAASTMQPLSRQSLVTLILVVIAEHGQPFWRVLGQLVDTLT